MVPTRALAPALIVAGSWYWMQILHECGHAAAAAASGGRVAGISLQFLRFSRTDVGPNPHPLGVALAGPVLGALIPTLLPVLLRGFVALRPTLVFLAGFCLIANGAYVSFGAIDRDGDAGDLLRLGAPVWLLWTVGMTAVAAGLWIWHAMGSRGATGAGSAGGRLFAAGAFAGCAAAIVALI